MCGSSWSHPSSAWAAAAMRSEPVSPGGGSGPSTTPVGVSGPPDRAAASTMRATRYQGPQRVSVVELPMPRPGPGEVLLRVHAAGICGSDLHRYRGEWEQSPATPCHEVGASVAELGHGVEG